MRKKYVAVNRYFQFSCVLPSYINMKQIFWSYICMFLALKNEN